VPADRPPSTGARGPVAVGARVRVEFDERRHTGLVRSLTPALTIEVAHADTIYVPAHAAVYMQALPCDYNAGAEGGAWVGVVAGWFTQGLVDNSWAKAGVYFGTILVSSAAGSAVQAIDCRRWKRVR
jgi:hypothetical protein